MNTTLAGRLPALQRRLEQEELAALATERREAIATIAECESKLSAICPGHDATVRAAEVELDNVKLAAAASVKAAEQALADARLTRGQSSYPLNRRIDEARGKLEGILCHPAVTAGLETIEQIQANNSFVSDEMPTIPLALEAWRRDHLPHQKQQYKLHEWCRTATQQLRDLRFSPSEDIPLLVQSILADQPDF